MSWYAYPTEPTCETKPFLEGCQIIFEENVNKIHRLNLASVNRVGQDLDEMVVMSSSAEVDERSTRTTLSLFNDRPDFSKKFRQMT